jgi:LPXTG-motif cell wall-anchored protein
MNAPANRPGRALTRLAAITAAASLGTLAFAAPAAAQAPVPVGVYVEDNAPVAVGEEPTLFAAQINFGEDFPTGTHAVTATITIDAAAGLFAIGDDSECTPDAAGTEVECVQGAADRNTYFDFPYAATAAPTAVYDYTVVFEVDGETVATVEDSLQVTRTGQNPPVGTPYLHAPVSHSGVAPGTSVEVSPVFLQDRLLLAETVAVVVHFRGANLLDSHDDVKVAADYENCVAEEQGMACVVTDFTNRPGQAFTVTDPATYAIDAEAPGPIEICDCLYNVTTANARELENRFGGVFWDEASDDLLGIEATADVGEYGEPVLGTVSITTAANPYDLAVSDVKVKGAKGTKTTVDIAVTNEGPASAYHFFHLEGPGSYALLGNLPTGLKLVAVDERWACLDEADWDEHLGDDYDGDLGELDFVCFFNDLAVDQTRELAIEVEITGTTAKTDGTIEVIALEDGGYPGVADADAKNDTAKFSVNGGSAAQLPKTGTSLTLIIGIAAVVLAAGIVLMVLTARRRKTAAEEAIEE